MKDAMTKVQLDTGEKCLYFRPGRPKVQGLIRISTGNIAFIEPERKPSRSSVT